MKRQKQLIRVSASNDSSAAKSTSENLDSILQKLGSQIQAELGKLKGGSDLKSIQIDLIVEENEGEKSFVIGNIESYIMSIKTL